jgi:hypothetical protein
MDGVALVGNISVFSTFVVEMLTVINVDNTDDVVVMNIDVESLAEVSRLVLDVVVTVDSVTCSLVTMNSVLVDREESVTLLAVVNEILVGAAVVWIVVSENRYDDVDSGTDILSVRSVFVDKVRVALESCTVVVGVSLDSVVEVTNKV